MNDDYSKHIAEQHLGSPRLHMFMILNICGLIGFLTSYVLVRHLDLTIMWLRYGIAAVTAYVSFFVVLKFWIAFFIRGEAPDKKIISAKKVKKAWKRVKQGRKLLKLGKRIGKGTGGTGSGAGLETPSFSESFQLGDVISDGDDKDGFIVIVLVAALLSILLVAGMFIFSAPVFLGEVIISSLISSGGYKRFKGVPGEEWYATAFRRSRFYFLGLTVIVMLAGGILQTLAPEAVTIGDVLRVL